jgi:hypothetical protein
MEIEEEGTCRSFSRITYLVLYPSSFLPTLDCPFRLRLDLLVLLELVRSSYALPIFRWLFGCAVTGPCLGLFMFDTKPNKS